MRPTRFAGTPCWVDLSTPDPAAAAAFYGGVLGWTFGGGGADMGGYLLAAAAGVVVAGVGPKPEEAGPPAWRVYLHTPDVDAVVAGVEARGGAVARPPGDVGPFGRMAEIQDPGGAIVGLWQPVGHDGFGAMGPQGTPVWFEVNTRDSAAVRDFFAGLFELDAEQLDGMAYFMLQAGGRPRYGVLQMDEQWAGMDPSWMVYFSVEAVDAACERVTAAGGTVAQPPFDTPFGRIGVCRDPGGAAFTLITPAAAG